MCITSLAFKAVDANIDSTCVHTVNRGGSRKGTGKKKNKAEKHLRNSECLYNRTKLKNLRKTRNDEEVFNYLLELSFVSRSSQHIFNVFFLDKVEKHKKAGERGYLI